MGAEKAELKGLILAGLAEDAEERAEGLLADLYRLDGSRKVLDEARKAMERDIFARLKKDIDEGKVDAEKEAPLADRYIKTCIHLIMHMHKGVVLQQPIQQGRLDECNYQIDSLRKKAEAEKAKKDALDEAALSGTVEKVDGELEEVPTGEKGPNRRPTGTRPAPPLKGRRQESYGEDVDARGAAPPAVEEKPSKEEAPKPKRRPRAKPAPKKRPRKKTGD